MTMIQMFQKEMEQEALTTRKMLSRVPADKLDWQPHPKSMNLRSLATHVAELPAWLTLVLTSDGLDFATTPYNPFLFNTNEELMAHFEKSLIDGRSQLIESNEAKLDEIWTLRMGNQILNASSKFDNIRFTFCQIVHHRAQLGVYLRLLDIPIPGSYGPSADEPSF